ncbi:hypothetical protein T484DRAFT_1862981 [Baffinella frigidus]|nr:hypothetical protein T484DRAFT_1862981 [Cryptophyta sp. CCMP2293]
MSDDVANLASLAPWARLRAAVKSPEPETVVQRLGYPGAFRRQPTRTLLSTMMLESAAPQNDAGSMVRTMEDDTTISRTCSAWSNDGEDDLNLDVAASMKVLREHAARVKQMTPAPQPNLSGPFRARSRSFEVGAFEDPGGSFRPEHSRRRQISTLVPEAGRGGQSMSSMSSLVSGSAPEEGLRAGSFGSTLRRSILRDHFCPSADGGEQGEAREQELLTREKVRAHAREAVARNFQAQNFLERAPSTDLARRRSSMGDLSTPLSLPPQETKHP